MSQTTIDISTATAALIAVDIELAESEAENEQLRRQLDQARSLARRLLGDADDGDVKWHFGHELFGEAVATMRRWDAEQHPASPTDTIDDWHACNQPHTAETT